MNFVLRLFIVLFCCSWWFCCFVWIVGLVGWMCLFGGCVCLVVCLFGGCVWFWFCGLGCFCVFWLAVGLLCFVVVVV